jgi:hypothetical protein
VILEMCESRGAPVLLLYNNGVGSATSRGSGHVIFNGALSQSGNNPPTHTAHSLPTSSSSPIVLKNSNPEIKETFQGFWFFL